MRWVWIRVILFAFKRLSEMDRLLVQKMLVELDK